MRWLSWIIMLPLAAAVIVFSVSNRAVTQVDFWPFGYGVELPVFGIVLASMLLGFMLGGIVAWLSHAKKQGQARAVARDAKREAKNAQHELSELREASKQTITTQVATPLSSAPEQNRLTNDVSSRIF
jgi:uncharacterized integral membrane protein